MNQPQLNPQLILLGGGVRSGKSSFALHLAQRLGGRKVFLATAEARDEEMAERIAAHQARRDAGWQTIEAPHDLADALHAAPSGAAVLIDCLTLWLSNLMERGTDIETQMTKLQEALAERVGATVIVSNEVGLGIVPDNALVRRFRDLQGNLNQRLAMQASRVIIMIAGIAVAVKSP